MQVTEKLESKNLNIIDATKILKTCIKSLEIINSDDENMNREIHSAILFSTKQGVDPLNEFAMQHRRRLAPKKLDDNRDNLFTPELLTFYRMEFKKVLRVPLR